MGLSRGMRKQDADCDAVHVCAGVLGSQVSHKLFDKLKHAGANLAADLWPGHHRSDTQSPADSTATGESDLGLEGMAADSKHPIMST